MDASEVFLEQYDAVCSIVNDPKGCERRSNATSTQGGTEFNRLVSLAHFAPAGFCQHADYARLCAGARRATDDPMNVSRRDVGKGMTREECSALNEAVNLSGLRAYWGAVGNAVREVARSVPTSDLCKPVETRRLQQMLDDGTIANERARWLASFLEGKSKGWFLSMAIWHTAERLLGGVVCVRRVSGIPVGL
jgi:hypothetical protein